MVQVPTLLLLLLLFLLLISGLGLAVESRIARGPPLGQRQRRVRCVAIGRSVALRGARLLLLALCALSSGGSSGSGARVLLGGSSSGPRLVPAEFCEAELLQRGLALQALALGLLLALQRLLLLVLALAQLALLLPGAVDHQ